LATRRFPQPVYDSFTTTEARFFQAKDIRVRAETKRRADFNATKPILIRESGGRDYLRRDLQLKTTSYQSGRYDNLNKMLAFR